MEKRLMTTKEAAEYLNLAVQTLCNYRYTGNPPDYVKIGRKIMYEKSTLDRFIDAGRVTVQRVGGEL